jgi:hypothetical protein
MIKINRDIEKKLKELDINQVGSFFEEFGAFTDDETEFILYYKDDGIYLAHISEFEIEGVLIRLKKNEN